MLTDNLCGCFVLHKYMAVFKVCFFAEGEPKSSSASRGPIWDISSKTIFTTIFVFMIPIRILWKYLFYMPIAYIEAILFKTWVSCHALPGSFWDNYPHPAVLVSWGCHNKVPKAGRA